MNIGRERLMRTREPRKAPLAPLEGMLRVASSCSSHCFRYGSRLQHCSWHAGGSVPNVKKGLPTPAQDHQLSAGLHCTWRATAPLKQTLKDHHRACPCIHTVEQSLCKSSCVEHTLPKESLVQPAEPHHGQMLLSSLCAVSHTFLVHVALLADVDQEQELRIF